MAKDGIFPFHLTTWNWIQEHNQRGCFWYISCTTINFSDDLCTPLNPRTPCHHAPSFTLTFRLHPFPSTSLKKHETLLTKSTTSYTTWHPSTSRPSTYCQPSSHLPGPLGAESWSVVVPSRSLAPSIHCFVVSGAPWRKHHQWPTADPPHGALALRPTYLSEFFLGGQRFPSGFFGKQKKTAVFKLINLQCSNTSTHIGPKERFGVEKHLENMWTTEKSGAIPSHGSAK